MITQLFCAFFISIGRSRVLIYGAVVATVLNIVFDYLLIFGKFGFPEMGFRGAAVASVISEVFYCATMVGAFFLQKLYRDYPVLHYRQFDTELSQRTLKVAAPLIVQFMFSIGGWLIFFIFIEHLGGQALAASQVLRNIFGIVGVGTWALATACNTMVSNIIGQGRQNEVVGVIAKICKLSLIYAIVLCIFMLIYSREFLSVYSDDVGLVSYAVPSLRVIVLATLIMSISTVVFNGVVGTGNTVVNLLMEVTCVGVYLIYCYFIIRRWHSPLYVCWGSEFVYWLSLFACSAVYLRSGRWKGKEI
jgi:Na+-driven multidrug efflux pump